MYNWNDVIAKIDEDIAEYLKKRYKDYCKDKNEKDSILGNEAQRERHNYIKDELIKLGLVLHKKLGFFLPESRKELFEQIYERNRALDSFFKKRYDDFCKDLDKTNNALPLHKQRDRYKLHIEKSEKSEELLEYKEIMKNSRFVENIDERRAEYEKIKVEYEKKKAEDEKRRAEEKARKERFAKKKGHSNIKSIDFYERLYCRYGSPFGEKSFCVDYEVFETMQEEREWDVYFEENGIPNNDDYMCPKEEPFRYKPDSPEDNQYYLDRCKQLLEVFKPLILESDYFDFDDFDRYQAQMDVYQEYLNKKYLITRQIAHISELIGKVFWYSIDRKTRNRLSAFNKNKYKINVFDDDSFDIEEIKIKINKFTGREDEGEVKILTPIEALKEHLKKHDNRITAKEYSTLVNISYKMALVVLKKFVVNKQLKSIKESKGLNIFYV